jgi:hypothetical protein
MNVATLLTALMNRNEVHSETRRAIFSELPLAFTSKSRLMSPVTHNLKIRM